jgi:hypothetical protein
MNFEPFHLHGYLNVYQIQLRNKLKTCSVEGVRPGGKVSVNISPTPIGLSVAWIRTANQRIFQELCHAYVIFLHYFEIIMVHVLTGMFRVY